MFDHINLAQVKKQEAQRATYRAPENNVPPFWRIGQGGILFFRSAQKTQTW